MQAGVARVHGPVQWLRNAAV
eukprot:COSAG02_NODE_45842_length_353_cov_1.625984_1_plen_20_part_10